MKTAHIIKVEVKGAEPPRTASARRSPNDVEQQLTGYTLPELMRRSETVTEVLKHILEFPLPKNIRK